MEKEIIQKNIKGFNRSSKIMEYKLGINEARLLNTLVYKHNYWSSEKRLIKIGKELGFYVTIPNLQGETNLGPSVIKRCIKELKKSGLINVYKIGIPAKNHYVLNKHAIESFDDIHGSDYETWIDSLGYMAKVDRVRFDNWRSQNADNTHVLLIESQIGQNDPTGGFKMTPLDGSKSTVTKNKSTKNKILKTITNRTSAELDFVEFEEKLQLKIEELQDSNDDLDALCTNLHGFLCENIPKFEKFVPSDDDIEHLRNIAGYELDGAGISSKITSNMRSICDGKKKARFGNLFVGLKEIARNTEHKHTG